ncbi:phytase [Lyngbya aestuarii]|uniref:phytase n=1 Tax=Lyngbya aestuarii TaxID=118322 RepID=UPI00403DA837
MSIRFASFNASLNRDQEGELIADLSTPDNQQARNTAEIIQRVNPDVVLINEFDFDANETAANLFQQNYLSVSQNGTTTVEYPFVYLAPSNTGIPSGFDLDNNGEVGGPNDAYGFGFFPGQFGMVVYSKYPIDTANIRTFQNFLWKDMPDGLLPDDPATPEANDWYSPEELEVLPLSSKSHWDIPILVDGEVIHVLTSHPTPPVFDGPEDRNGRRNHDEIRFWADYITPEQGSYIYDDQGVVGGLTPGSQFVIMGDQNADPFDGDSTDNAVGQLLDNPLINTSVTPSSIGGSDASVRQGGANLSHQGNPALDTADFNDAEGASGNLRADYVLPSQNLPISEAAVFWPPATDPLFPLVGEFDPNLQPTGFPSSDHRLVWVDVEDANRKTVADVEFLGEDTFETGLVVDGTQVGGLSGITYDATDDLYYAISDDRSQNNPARFYTLTIDIADGDLQDSDVTFTGVTTLLDANGTPFPALSLDPEGITLRDDGTLYISSEGDANQSINPFVNQFSLQGQQLQELPVPAKFVPTADGMSGIRNNLAWESLTITPDERFLYTATENALTQDGPAADLENASPSRILRYNLATGEADQEFLYFTDPVAAASVPPDGFQTNGLVELLALDNTGSFLALERSFSAGVGNGIKLYEVRSQNTTDLSDFDSINGFEVDAAAEKNLLLDFADLGLTLDNIEGMTFGPKLPDGRQSLIVVSDNNFSDTQFTQFLSFALDINTIPAVTPTGETPSLLRTEDGSDADDPAIYVHPTNSSLSLVIATLKDAGLVVYDLNGQELQRIAPANPGDVRYNNVDLVYGFNLGGQSVDLAVASDRENDTLAVFQIDPDTRQLNNITADSLSQIPASIFGIDDASQTAYGLATYTSPVSGKPYVFVSQADGNQIAQLELVDNGAGQVDATVVRTLTVPLPESGELEDAQVEGMVVDRELGFLYAGQENLGIWKFAAEPDGSDAGQLIDTVRPEGSNLEADVEGLTIYYGAAGQGYLLASSQGDNTFAVYERGGSNQYLGSFVVGESQGIDSAEESDGADIINVPLGDQFPFGLLVVQDGSNDPAAVAIDEDGEEIQNFNANFKFVGLENLAATLPEFFTLDTESFNPRQLTSNPAFSVASLTTNDNNIFSLDGMAGEPKQLQFSLTGVDTSSVSEIGVFTVEDDQGTVKGILPEEDGYLPAALEEAQVIFSPLPDTVDLLGDLSTTQRQLGFESGDRLVFYLVPGSTTDAVLSGEATPVIFGSPSFNTDGVNSLQVTDLGNGTFSLGWEDQPGSSEEDFTDIELTVQTTDAPPTPGTQWQGQREIIDLREIDLDGDGQEDQTVSANLIINREAAFDNALGLYIVDDIDGGIDLDGDTLIDVRPGDEDYIQVALGERSVIDLNADIPILNDVQLPTGILAPYMIADGTRENFLESNFNSIEEQSPLVYFAYLGANPDNADHIRQLGDNVFGFEDLPDGGDQDFNDLVLQVNFG